MSIIRTLGNSNADLADKTNDTEKYYNDFQLYISINRN
jgi:hypothetical protein